MEDDGALLSLSLIYMGKCSNGSKFSTYVFVSIFFNSPQRLLDYVPYPVIFIQCAGQKESSGMEAFEQVFVKLRLAAKEKGKLAEEKFETKGCWAQRERAAFFKNLTSRMGCGILAIIKGRSLFYLKKDCPARGIPMNGHPLPSALEEEMYGPFPISGLASGAPKLGLLKK